MLLHRDLCFPASAIGSWITNEPRGLSQVLRCDYMRGLGLSYFHLKFSTKRKTNAEVKMGKAALCEREKMRKMLHGERRAEKGIWKNLPTRLK